ncbi:hypothetical protein [Methylomonas methanica]|uniref:hypothetical protein n=1 Tax=Methylomonas methanica TaxID=421 RepID=UPI000AFBEDD6|nr:hypothetical protein [Methylomonas methanica]
MNNDLVKGELSADQQNAVMGLINQIQNLLPFLIDLNADERRALPKLGDKSRAFVDQGLYWPCKIPAFCRAVSIWTNISAT